VSRPVIARPLRVVVAIDAFKGSLSSADAGAAAARGVLAAAPDAQVRVLPVADGGEGTIDALLAAVGGRRVAAPTVDARGRAVAAGYAVLADGGEAHDAVAGAGDRGVRSGAGAGDGGERSDGTAVIESASCVGLAGAAPADDGLPPVASSAGVGLLLRHAIDSGARRIAVTLGGTACTDGGLGMLLALGARAVDGAGRSIAASGENPLWRFAALDGALPTLDGVDLRVLTDVDAPLHGPRGAAHVFGPQKGATPEQVAHLDDRLAALGRALAAAGHPVADRPGAGAAGGLGAALLALGARQEAGFAFVARTVGLAEAITGADLVLTGEGRIDAQTAGGKTPAGVAALARAAGARIVALAGSVEHGSVEPGSVTADLFDAALGVHDRPLPLAEAMDPAVTAAGIERTAGRVVNGVLAARRRA
jgi:glycerate kinase